MLQNRFHSIFLILILAVLPLTAKDWTAADIPMVHLEDARRYVCDPEGLMTPALRDSTDFYLQKLESERGVQSVFVIVNHVANADAFRVAQDIGNGQGVGDNKTNRGLVVVVAVEDHKYFIAPGEGLEDELTDMACGEIGRACIVQNMRIGNIDNALFFTAKAIYNKVLTGQSGIEEEEDDGFAVFLLIFFIILFAFVFWGLFYNLLRKILGYFGITLPPIINTTTSSSSKPFIILDDFHDFGSGGSFGGGSIGGSFGGGSFGGGGAGGSW